MRITIPSESSGLRAGCATLALAWSVCLLAATDVVTSTALAADAAEKTEVKPILLAGDKLSLTPPAGWTYKEPRFRGIVDYEYSIAPVKGDSFSGRVTVGGAGGGIEANKQRWIGQYRQPDGKKTADRARLKEKKIAKCTVHLLDITGTYNAPPFEPGGGGAREGYRMLAAIIDAGKMGAYYVKCYGPARTIAEEEAGFNKMIDGLARQP